MLKMQWLFPPHKDWHHGLSYDTLPCDKNENGLVTAVRLDSLIPVLYTIVQYISIIWEFVHPLIIPLHVSKPYL